MPPNVSEMSGSAIRLGDPVAPHLTNHGFPSRNVTRHITTCLGVSSPSGVPSLLAIRTLHIRQHVSSILEHIICIFQSERLAEVVSSTAWPG
jgi:hypothetical protein